jgi:phosphoglycerate dehydrogenase-like enzyme
MKDPKILLYTKRGDLDEYYRLLAAGGLAKQLIVCRDENDLESAIPEAEIIFGVHLPPDTYAKASRLRWIQSMWAGVEGLVKAPIPPGVIITRPLGVFGPFISHYIFGNLLAWKIRLRDGLAQQAEHRWQHYKIGLLSGMRLGIAGMGDIGSEVARIGKCFRMEIWGLNRKRISNELLDRTFGLDEIREFVSGIDVLAIILPSTTETRGLFDRELLSMMKPDALLINVGRGAVIDDDALIEILKQGRIAGAVLDVFTQEPLPPEHPFWGLPNCTVTSHVGGPSLPEDITRCFLENYKRYMLGEKLPGQVDRMRGY